MFDTTTEFGARVESRLRQEKVVWLTTVGADGTPQPRPVWFLWDGAAFLIFSQPQTAKLRHIGVRPGVALHLNSDEVGGDIVVFTGRAEVMAGAPPEEAMAAYLEKYREGIAGLGMTTGSFAAAYHVPIRVTPGRLRGF